MFRVLLLCFVLAFGPAARVAMAQTTVGETPGKRNAPGMPNLGGQGITQGADQGKKSQNSGAAINMAVSGAMFAACMATCATTCQWALCAMGAMAALQAAQHKDSANKSGQTYDASLYGGGGFNYNADGSGSDAIVPGLSKGDFAKYPAIKEGMTKFREAGFTPSPSGIKNPDGSFTPASTFNSAGSMAAAGIPQPTIDQAQQILNDAKAVGEDGPKVSSVGVNGGGGGGGSSANSADSSSESVYKPGNPFKLTEEQKKDLMAGKTVLFDGEPIGVRGNNIFDMIHAAYKRKKDANYFITDSAPPAGGGSRLPASAHAAQPAKAPAQPIKPATFKKK